MSELFLNSNENLVLDTGLETKILKTENSIRTLGKVTVLELLAEPMNAITPEMTYQSAWTNREDR